MPAPMLGTKLYVPSPRPDSVRRSRLIDRLNVGLPTYPSAYDKFLLLVSMGFNVVTVWTVWNWV